MASGVEPVDQAGFRRGVDLAEQRLDAEPGDASGECAADGLLQDALGLPAEIGERMGTGPGARLGGFPAEQAASAGQADFLPVHLGAVGSKHVHVEETPEAGALLNV